MKEVQAPSDRKKKLLMVIVAAIAVLAVLIAVVPLLFSMLGGGGVKTEGIDASRLKPAETDINGDWQVQKRPGANATSVGFTFDEVLPGEAKTTSGSTSGVEGEVHIEAGVLQAGKVLVDMTNLTTDSDVRDNNVRRKILHTDQFSTSSFTITEPIDLSEVPRDGSVGSVEVIGDLTIHGETNRVTAPFDVALSGSHLIVAGDVPFNRLDYGVETPEFVAAKIAETGTLNIRLNMAK
ncbi:hypothetical protein BJP08_03060 [Corynebacterium sp. NML140438]|uniref:YceI family protein n=1 Tax=Corynebacterium sp. NML140438 TaxID=1906334 RepID=UPI0008FB3547|nr:YceI family protein [Corynebacterium sp. NML140438]OIR42316.1 hypothetical protein BJP08_03060 [Corynebacterium sp. NML140438]